MAREHASGVRVVALTHSGSGADTALRGSGAEVLVRTVDGDEAVAAVARSGPDAVLVDLSTGGGLPLAVVTRAAPLAPVLAVSGSAERAAVLAVLEAGARGYLVGPLGSVRLGDALARTAAGASAFSQGLAELVLAAEAENAPPAAATRLTGRELDVLRLVVDGLTARQIATRLVLSVRTVENHVQSLLRKLDLPNRAALVRYAVENGLA